MPIEQQEQWLEDTRRFWDVDNAFDAKYRRICLDPEIEATTDESELESLWAKRTADELACLTDGIPLDPDWTCLEIGSGIGRLLKPIAERCHKVIGVDISEKMTEHARAYLRNVENVELFVNDGRTLSMVPNGSIDFVYSLLTFQHITLIEVVEGYLAEVARVLKPDGYCRIQTWREEPIPTVQRVKNLARVLLGRERYHGPRCWNWSPDRQVRFGGMAFHPGQWRRLQRKYGLHVESMQLGIGHDYWMWTTSRKRQPIS